MKRFHIFNLLCVLSFSFSLQANFTISCEKALSDAQTVLKVLEISDVIDENTHAVLHNEIDRNVTSVAAENESLTIDAQRAKNIVCDICAHYVPHNVSSVIDTVFDYPSTQRSSTLLAIGARDKNWIEHFLHPFQVIDFLDPSQTYHLKSIAQLNGGWTCGMFCLYNALNIERTLGIAHQVDFTKECANFCHKNSIDPFGGLSNDSLLKLADSALKLNNAYPLTLGTNGNVQPLIRDHALKRIESEMITEVETFVQKSKHCISVELFIPKGLSKDQITQYNESARNKGLDELLQEIKQKITGKTTPQVAHFICNLEKEKHWILASVVCLPGEKPFLVVFDNCNKPLDEYEHATNYIQQLSELFL